MTTLYPLGYGTTLVTLVRLKQLHGPKMHPEFSRRVWPWLESMGGLIGIGSGWRAMQPTGDQFAPAGKSFHESQSFSSGIVAYCALDLVARDPGKVHRAPTWAEGSTASTYGLHTFIKNPPEPWHLQPIELRGWQSFVDAGRPDPAYFQLPEDDDMQILPKPYRSFDSRNTRGPLLPGETITVPVGQCSKATVRIGSIGQGGDGFLFVNGAGDTSLANFTHLSPINSDTVPVLTPNGQITISAEVSKAHFTVDVYAVA